MIRKWLRWWLGYDEDFASLHKHLADLHSEMIGMRSDLSVTFYDEHDPRRKEVSDKLGKRTIERLKAEDQARKHTLGEI